MCFSSRFRYLPPYITHEQTDHQLLKQQLQQKNIPYEVYLDNLKVSDIEQVEYEDQLSFQSNKSDRELVEKLPPVIIRKRDNELPPPCYAEYEYNHGEEYVDEKKNLLDNENPKAKITELPLPVTANSDIYNNADSVQRRRRIIGSMFLLFLILMNVWLNSSGCMMDYDNGNEVDESESGSFGANYHQALDFNY